MRVYLVLNSAGGKLHRQYAAAMVDAEHDAPLISYAEFLTEKGLAMLRPDLWSHPDVDIPSTECQ